MTPFVDDRDFTLYIGDARDVLADLPPATAECCVTSPPYWGLRDYGADGQIGREASPEEYVAALVAVFAEVRRVLVDTGTLWLNLGDSYAAKARGSDRGWDKSRLTNPGRTQKSQAASLRDIGERHRGKTSGLKEKDMVGIPWRVAFALQADGWYLRSDIVWSKPNPMPESVVDRPSKSHEYIFLLAKSTRYHFDQDAVREPNVSADDPRFGRDRELVRERNVGGRTDGFTRSPVVWNGAGRNVRTVWEIATTPYPEAHFATFPQEIPRRCIAAGCPEGGLVLDPFMGSGTTALVARQLGRRSVGVELNPDYAQLTARRLGQQSIIAEGAA